MDKMCAIDGWLTAREAAKIIGKSYTQVTRYCDQNLLPHKRVSRAILIRREDAEAFEPPPRGNPQFLLHGMRCDASNAQATA